MSYKPETFFYAALASLLVLVFIYFYIFNELEGCPVSSEYNTRYKCDMDCRTGYGKDWQCIKACYDFHGLWKK
jgi:hypothetical protein